MASVLDLAKELDMSYNTLYRHINKDEDFQKFVTFKSTLKHKKIIINDYAGLKQSILSKVKV
jgi:hypothetical protein